MFRFVALLRAINVGRGRTVKMQSLRRLFESLGFCKVATFIASGNVIFETAKKRTRTLERKIEKTLHETLGYEVGTFIRGEAELTKIVNYHPFSRAKLDRSWHRNIVFLEDNLSPALKRKVKALRTNTDVFEVRGREIYWLRRRKQNGTFSTVPLEKTLGRAFTVRGADTIKRIASKWCSQEMS